MHFFTGPVWDVLADSSAVFGTLGGMYAIYHGGRRLPFFVAKDGIIVPSYLADVQDVLDRTLKLFSDLDEEEKALIAQARQASDKTLDELSQEYNQHLAECEYQVLEHEHDSWLAKTVPFHPVSTRRKEKAAILMRQVRGLHRDALTTTHGRRREKAERDRRRLEDQMAAEAARITWEPDDELAESSPAEIAMLPLTASNSPSPVQVPPRVCLVPRPWEQITHTLIRQPLMGVA